MLGSVLLLQMAYSNKTVISLKSSASLIPNNLAVVTGLERESSVTYAVVHRGTVLIAHITSGVCRYEQTSYSELADRNPGCFLTQVRRKIVYM